MASQPTSPDLAFSDTEEHLVANPKTSAAPQSSNFHGIKSADLYATDQIEAPEAPVSGMAQETCIDARTRLSSLLKDKEQEWATVVEKKGPLNLLDLPMDVLKEIVKEVTHTNDLTALALTHTALHNLAIPHIYSRFDIVWPDAHATTDPRTGVDALTYGLATLCMGDVLNSFQLDGSGQQYACMNCGTVNIAQCNHAQRFEPKKGQRRIGNHYPQFTRKFSLGNGPPDWVQEYLITKESGKMLGTLVALAVARMVNLETFVWDMPTGVLRDVWLALSSLQNRPYDQDCRLERVWVRWHDNSDPANLTAAQSANPPSITTPQMLAGSSMTQIGWNIPAGSAPTPSAPPPPIPYAQSRVEFPTLSVLPPLKSLSVLDIDELDYLDEMSVLISKSKDRLRELRVGLSATAINRDFALAWDAPDLHQVDHNAAWPGASTISERRLGGVLGVLLGRVFDIRRKQKVKAENKDIGTSMASSTPIPAELQLMQAHITSPGDVQNEETVQIDVAATSSVIPSTGNWKAEPTAESSPLYGVTFEVDEILQPLGADGLGLNPHGSNSIATESAQSDIESLTALIAAHELSPSPLESSHPSPGPEGIPGQPLRRSKNPHQRQSLFSEKSLPEREKLEGKLQLQTLELERVPLSVAVLQKGFDWSILTNLTILDCAQHERLWNMLRRHFQPTPIGGGSSSSKHHAGATLQYHLSLKKVHTDSASVALISFLKDTLAPNTLEILFLQDRRRSAAPPVTIDAIYRGPLKRHRASLKKLMLDSSERIPRGPANSTENSRWRAWMPNRDILSFILSGRMSSLRELSIAIDYKDWHHFLQRLPQIPHLRSLNVPFIADHVTPAFDPKELALQVVDIIVLRPEVELCYMGVSNKCFEILENRAQDEAPGAGDAQSSAANGAPGSVISEDEDEEGSEDEDDDAEEEDDNGTAIGAPIGLDPDETESEMSDHEFDSDSYEGSDIDIDAKARLRLREILFYDDKVAIFKARHGKL